MMSRIALYIFAGTLLLASALLTYGSLDAQGKKKSSASKQMIKRGEYLVTVGVCDDCHSPKIFTAEGPVVDTTRRLSGHPAGDKVPDVPEGAIGPDKWGALATNHLTSWTGPWGTSFARNLTPDVATGLGSWTPEMFIKAIRTGKDMGEGRAILPPMPWPNYRQMTDDDLQAIFAFLRTLKPIENAVPNPIPPASEPVQSGKDTSR
jgi:hypothetical protein